MEAYGPDTTSATIAAWIKYEASAGFPTVFESEYKIYVTSGTLAFMAKWTTGTGKWSASGTFDDGNWHHFAITYDGSSLDNAPAIYVDGVVQTIQQDSTPSGTERNNPGPACIGSATGGGRCFAGQIDDFRFYGRMLSAPEVQALAARGK